MPPFSAIGSNHQKNLTTTHRTSTQQPSTQQPSSMQNDGNSSTANDGNPALNLQIVKGQEFNDLESFKQAVMDWAIAMHFSTRTVKSDK
jgi:hypothetical protein